MMRCSGRYAWILSLLLVPLILAGASPSVEGAAPTADTTGPAQPIPPNRVVEQAISAPFQLTSDEQKEVDRLLAEWEKWNSQVKTFDCRFKRWTYDTVLGPANEAKFVDTGLIRYGAPDRAVFLVEAPRAEHWAFDGKSLFEYKAAKKQLVERKLAPELQGTHFVDGPLAFPIPTFLFAQLFGGDASRAYRFPLGAKAAEVKEQYYIRAITPPDRKEEIWLEAYPRSPQLARMWRNIQLICNAKDMSPLALKLVHPSGKDWATFQFFDIVVNGPPPAKKGEPFRPATPPGWQTVVE